MVGGEIALAADQTLVRAKERENKKSDGLSGRISNGVQSSSLGDRDTPALASHDAWAGANG
jgi:hypothetical protein